MAGFMREQMCKFLCPYARFQGVMFDPDTLIITYDAARGGSRVVSGARMPTRQKRNWAIALIAGSACQVCPTGIDIRNGLQYECIACAAAVMLAMR